MAITGWCPMCGKPGPLGEVHRCDGPDPRDQRIRELEAQLAEVQRLAQFNRAMAEKAFREIGAAEREHAAQLRAERDAAVEALKATCRCEYSPITQRYDSDCDSCQALASLPQAALRAQAVLDVVAAARLYPWPYEHGKIEAAIARLDALDRGGE